MPRRSSAALRTRFIVTVLGVVVLVVLALVLRDPGFFTGREGTEEPGRGTGIAQIPDGQTAQEALGALPTQGKAPRTGYSREEFGARWADVDHNGCDTRNDVLARDLTDTTLRGGTCTVAGGVLQDPYTGRTIRFTAGERTSATVQIDHVVALSDAWQTGAQQLSGAQRESLANDPLNLLAVDGKTNNGKSDGDAATWLPPNKGFRCEYVARQAGVKEKYGLWVTSAERTAMHRVLQGCPDQKIPTA